MGRKGTRSTGDKCELSAHPRPLHMLTSVSPESRALVAMTELPPAEVIHTHPPLSPSGFFLHNSFDFPFIFIVVNCTWCNIYCFNPL